MLMPKSPIREYAASSALVVLRFAAQDIRLATLTESRRFSWTRTSSSTPVISAMRGAKPCFESSARQSLEKNATWAGAINSCSVQPLVNHSLLWKAELRAYGSSS